MSKNQLLERLFKKNGILAVSGSVLALDAAHNKLSEAEPWQLLVLFELNLLFALQNWAEMSERERA